jgi:hypothetical protein
MVAGDKTITLTITSIERRLVVDMVGGVTARRQYVKQYVLELWS